MYGGTLEELKKKIEVFVGYCEKKNFKLKPSKMVISEEVEFAGTAIRAETVENEDVVSILPRDKRVKAFMDLKKTRDKEGNPGGVWHVKFIAGMESKPTAKLVNAEESDSRKGENSLE